MIDKKVDLFSSVNLAVIAVILIVGIGGSYIPENVVSGIENSAGMIPMFGIQLPPIATAALLGIALNLLLNIKKKKPAQPAQEETAQEEAVQE